MHRYSTRRAKANLDPRPLMATAKLVADQLPKILTSIADDIKSFQQKAANVTSGHQSQADPADVLIKERDECMVEIGQFVVDVWFLLRDENNQQEERTTHVLQAHKKWIQAQIIPKDFQEMGEKCADALVTANFLSTRFGRIKYLDPNFFMQSLTKSERFTVCSMQQEKMEASLAFLADAPTRAKAVAAAAQVIVGLSAEPAAKQCISARSTRASSRAYIQPTAMAPLRACLPPPMPCRNSVAKANAKTTVTRTSNQPSGQGGGKNLIRVLKRKTTLGGPPNSLHRLPTARPHSAIAKTDPRCITLDNVPPHAIYFQCHVNHCNKVTILYSPVKNREEGENQQALGRLSQLLDQLGFTGPPDRFGRRCVNCSLTIVSPALGRLSYQQPFKSHRKHLHECIRRHHNLVPNDVVDQSLLPPFFRDRRFYGDPTEVDTTISMSLKEKKAQSRDRIKKFSERKDFLLRSFLASEEACNMVFGDRIHQLVPLKFYHSAKETTAKTEEELDNMEKLP